MTSTSAPSVPVVAMPAALRGVLHRWFVVFNPLYLASTLCMLVGVWLVSDGLTASGSVYGDIWLTGVIELYQLALIGGVAVLYRGLRQARPAVMLALLAATYACDPTFRVENAAPLGMAGMGTTLVWIVLSYTRFLLLLWALRLRMDARCTALLSAGVLWLAITPQLLAHIPTGHEAILLGAYGVLGGMVLSFRTWRPTITSCDELTPWGESVLRQGTLAAWVGFAAFALYHLASWHVAHAVSPSVLHVAAVLLVATHWPRREIEVWWVTGLALVLGLAATRFVYVTPLLAAVMLLANGARLGAPRLYLGAVVVGWLAVRLEHPAAVLHVVLDVAVGGWFVLVAWRFRLRRELLVALSVGGAVVATRLGVEFRAVHLTRLQWGVALVASGFGLLAAGLIVNWRVRANGEATPDTMACRAERVWARSTEGRRERRECQSESRVDQSGSQGMKSESLAEEAGGGGDGHRIRE